MGKENFLTADSLFSSTRILEATATGKRRQGRNRNAKKIMAFRARGNKVVNSHDQIVIHVCAVDLPKANRNHHWMKTQWELNASGTVDVGYYSIMPTGNRVIILSVTKCWPIWLRTNAERTCLPADLITSRRALSRVLFSKNKKSDRPAFGPSDLTKADVMNGSENVIRQSPYLFGWLSRLVMESSSLTGKALDRWMLTIRKRYYCVGVGQ